MSKLNCTQLDLNTTSTQPQLNPKHKSISTSAKTKPKPQIKPRFKSTSTQLQSQY